MGRIDRFWSRDSGSSTVYHSNLISSTIIRDRIDELDRFVREAIQSRNLDKGDIEVDSYVGNRFYELRLKGKGVYEEIGRSGHMAEGDRINAAIVEIARAVEERFLEHVSKEEATRLRRGD